MMSSKSLSLIDPMSKLGFLSSNQDTDSVGLVLYKINGCSTAAKFDVSQLIQVEKCVIQNSS